MSTRQFTCTVEIGLPLDRVIELFDNVDNLKEWQDGFVSFEHLSGTPGEPGAKSKMIYKVGKREIELIETIIVKCLPREFTGKYEAKSMVNTMTNRFTSIEDKKIRYDAEIEYTKFNGIIPKLIGLFMSGVFRKQTQKWLVQFKEFAEKEGE